ncbi:tyrosine-type recombinase/integrase [Deinococcus pimensis]|uniref:tyrosine-type recombinase/integrase n=1 Tax=Deinococcus pimensis TaxID=309888 RepID=UPI0006937B47|nr:tyrosine-type recombinase/integrase [Deinococcus pimensis]
MSGRRDTLIHAMDALDVEAALRLVRGHARRGVVSDHTLESYRAGLVRFFGYVRQHHLRVVDLDRLEAGLYRDELRRTFRAATVVARLAPVRQLYRALLIEEVTTRDPFAEVVVPKPKDAPPRPYAQAEVDAMLDCGLTATEEVLVLLGANGGLRRDEMLRLTWGDVDLAANRMKVFGKGRKERSVRVSRSLRAALHRLAEERADTPAEGRVLGFDATHQLVYALEKIVTRAKVPWRGVHSLRRAAGSRLHRETGSLQAAQKLLGHASIETTTRYTFHDDTHDAKVEDW